MSSAIRSFAHLAVPLSLAVIFVACSSTMYPEPQPPGKTPLDAIPSSFLGTYIGSDEDTLEISPNGFREVHIGRDSRHFLLGDSIKVKWFAGQLFFNVLNDNGYWVLYLARAEGDAIYLSALNAKDCVGRLRQICPVEEVANDDGSLDYYLLSPTKKDWRKIVREHLPKPTDTLKALPKK
jgi:hypothetical protein